MNPISGTWAVTNQAMSENIRTSFPERSQQFCLSKLYPPDDNIGQLSAMRYISNMADVVETPNRIQRRQIARSRRRRDDFWIGSSALLAALCALPLAQSSWHGPE